MKRPYDDAYLMAYSEEHVWYEVWMFFELVATLNRHAASASSTIWSASTTAPTISAPPVGFANTIAPPVATASVPTTLTTNAYVEAFMAHSRNLIEFLFSQNPRATDVVAIDFCAAGTWSPTRSRKLDDVKTRVDKELAHLTSDRISGSPTRKQWDVNGVAQELRPVLRDFVAKALPTRLSPRVQTAIQ